MKARARFARQRGKRSAGLKTQRTAEKARAAARAQSSAKRRGKLLFPEAEQSLLHIGLAADPLQLITGLRDDILQLRLIQRLLADNLGLILRMRGVHLLNLKILSNRVVYMCLAHIARHACDV